MAPDRPISAQQKKFAELYVKGTPAGRAYEQAGYSAKGASADSAGSKLLRNDKVAEYIKELQQEAKDDTVMDVRERMQFLTRAIRTPIGEVTEESDLCVEYTKRTEVSSDGEDDIADVEKYKKVDPLRAMDILNKMDGSYAPEKHEHSFTSIGEIIDQIQDGK